MQRNKPFAALMAYLMAFFMATALTACGGGGSSGDGGAVTPTNPTPTTPTDPTPTTPTDPTPTTPTDPTSKYSLVAKASGGTYDKTECVKDNTTGLVWEGKTASPATSRLGTSTYTNFDDANSAQKWVSGTTHINPTQAQIDASTNSIGYKNSVNTSALCGYTDWRLPTKEELQGILASSGSPRIDTAWFPNTQADWYWSSSPNVGYSNYAWGLYFNNGVVNHGTRVSSYAVRLVRASQ